MLDDRAVFFLILACVLILWVRAYRRNRRRGHRPITIESRAPDGAAFSTEEQARRQAFADDLTSRGYKAVAICDPGDPRLRDLLRKFAIRHLVECRADPDLEFSMSLHLKMATNNNLRNHDHLRQNTRGDDRLRNQPTTALADLHLGHDGYGTQLRLPAPSQMAVDDLFSRIPWVTVYVSPLDRGFLQSLDTQASFYVSVALKDATNHEKISALRFPAPSYPLLTGDPESFVGPGLFTWFQHAYR